MAIQTWEMLDIEGYDDVPVDHDSKNLSWFKIIVASGTFVVKSCCSDNALIMSDSYAEELRNNRVCIDIGNGLPFITELNDEESAQFENTWFRGKPDVSLLEYRNETNNDYPEHVDVETKVRLADYKQGVIFDRSYGV